MSARRVPGVLEVLVASLVITLGTFVCLNQVAADPPMMGVDASVWVDLGRDCLELGKCHPRGAGSSFALDTGAAWTDLLMLVQVFHGTSLAERTLVFALLAVGIGTLFNVLWRWLGLAVALPSALTALELLRLCHDPPILINSSASFFPDTLCFVALLVFAWTRRLPALGVAAVFMSVSVNMHLSALVLVPPLVLVAVLGSERPAPALALTLGVSLIVSTLIAFASMLINLSILPTELQSGALHPGLLLGAVATLAVLVWYARPWFLHATVEGRAVLVCLAMLLPWVGLLVWLSVFTGQRPGLDFTLLTGTYGLAMIAPAAALCGMVPVFLIDRVSAWMRSGPRVSTLGRVLVVGVNLVAVPRYLASLPPMDMHMGGVVSVRRDITLEDGRMIDRYLEARGWDYERLVDHVQNPDCQSVLAGIVTYAGRPTPAPRDFNPFTQLRIWIFPDAMVPAPLSPDMERLPLRHGRSAVISPIQSWIDFSGTEYCLPEADALHCASVFQPAAPPRAFLFSARGALWAIPSTPIHPASEFLSMPLVATASQREISVYSDESCAWRIARVDGLDFEHTESPTTVRITGRDGATGRLWIERNRAECHFGWGPRPPCLMERRPDDPEFPGNDTRHR